MQRRKVLLVDDDLEIANEMKELLEFIGVTAVVENSALEARKRVIEDQDIACVVTDFRMAELDGAKLVSEVRQALPEGRDVRFIILTGMVNISQETLPTDVLLLAKPFKLEEMTQGLGSILG